MEILKLVLGLIGFGALLFGAAWLVVRFMKGIQDNSDRRYSESTDDGQLGSRGGSAF